MAAYATAAGKPSNAFDLGRFAPQEVELWPENWRAWALFSEMGGQWRMSSMGGPMSLDYTPLFMRMNRMGLTDDEFDDLFVDVRVLESAALEQMRNNG